MSQVVVTEDKLQSKRQHSLEQEHRIATNDEFVKWHKSDVTHLDLLTKAIGYAVLPILAFWGFIAGFMYLVLTAIDYVFKFLGRVIGGTKSLITGH